MPPFAVSRAPDTSASGLVIHLNTTIYGREGEWFCLIATVYLDGCDLFVLVLTGIDFIQAVSSLPVDNFINHIIFES